RPRACAAPAGTKDAGRRRLADACSLIGSAGKPQKQLPDDKRSASCGHTRGRIIICDTEKLQNVACKCYRAVKYKLRGAAWRTIKGSPAGRRDRDGPLIVIGSPRQELHLPWQLSLWRCLTSASPAQRFR